ncbi:MAG TPA: membrane protein insertion efficiency factor YidD [Vicinamibacterales bacterium]|nr:membrane protein insertion efficiency factor YidD [Vicinamibacterales bacterium]
MSSGRRRLATLAAFAILAVLVAANAQAIAITSIHGYQRALSPLAARIGLRCRFTPTCSRYAETAIARDGVMRGGARALARIARCGPWTAQGTRDEP